MLPRDPVLEYLTVIGIDAKGRITVPRQFRKSLGLRKGVPVKLLRLGRGLILFPEQQSFERLCDKMRAALIGAGVKTKDLSATLPAARQRVFARRYGSAPSAR